MKKKLLIIRFSSIGDIVLTTPIIRCLRNQLQNAEIHFVCKEKFGETIRHNPYIDKKIYFKKDLEEVLPVLKSEKYTYVIDLHNNLRSFLLKRALNTPSFSFNKINFRKLLCVWFKNSKLLPPVHIVDRYFNAVKPLGVINDNNGLDYFISKEDEFTIEEKFPELKSNSFIALVAGGSYFTKRIPVNKLIEICKRTNKQFIVLGGNEEADEIKKLVSVCNNVVNACGLLTLNQSAYVIKKSELVITSDTGLMHIAAAFHKKIISFWGNTIPEFGMSPYMPHPENKIMEIKNLKCRPCSKLGYNKCPKGHFNCMNLQDVQSLNL